LGCVFLSLGAIALGNVTQTSWYIWSSGVVSDGVHLSHKNQGDGWITSGRGRGKIIWEESSRTPGAPAHVRL
jgi:hypothetical protein